MSQSKVLSLVSLATRAGKTASGEFCTEKEVKSGRAFLVLVADDASDNDTLGHAMGKEMRASLAVLDEGFAKGILKHIKAEESQTV